ncbi:MAG: threonine--tRNA ligase [Planctomycetota bacterium]|nr:MAG: threonine--tRNA ligase [Planctomycetota bacterium]
MPSSGRVALLKVSLPDGTTLDVAEGSAAADVAAMLGPGLARKAVAARIVHNGRREIIDLHRPLPGDCELTLLTAGDDDPDSLYVLRHSAAHVMAEAICKLFPETKLVYGPPLEDGFYYDIDLPRSLTPGDFADIEAEMRRIVKEDRPFRRYELPREEAMAKLREEGNRYKLDNAERAEGDTLSFYVTGETPGKDFEDLCRGPHLPRTGWIKAFKVRQVSRSFYRGDVNDQPLQRVYGTAFYKKSSLDAFLKQLEEARKRDHRVLGKELHLFTVTDRVGTGLVLWQPKGTVIRNELQNYLTSEMVKLGYDLVVTPHIGQLGLYRTSGHYPYYEESQYPAMFETDRGKAIQAALQFARRVSSRHGGEREAEAQKLRALVRAIEQVWGPIGGAGDETSPERMAEALQAALVEEPGYLLKPMNCPHHIQLYAARPHSYRDLPVRLAEFGTVYRYEQSGEVSGMTRVRGFTQDDAHLFCTVDQLQEELLTTVALTRQVLEVLGLTDYRVRVGLRDPASDKYVGSAENWSRAESALREAARASGMAFAEEIGEAAFYGPKIDFVVKDCIGRSWQLGTVQVDYNLPERFDLHYVGKDNRPHRPIMIHRAPFGSMERFVGILIEHFEGAFPLWLSPVQVGVATVSEKSVAYGRRVRDALSEAGLRVVLDAGDEKIGPKKHRLRTEKVNYILVVGEQEAADGTVNVNDRSGRTGGNMSLERFIEGCRKEIESRGRRTLLDSGS